MLMSRRIWLVVATVALVAASFVASGVAARPGTEERPGRVTRGLDYFHARQSDTGGFSTPDDTAWTVLGAVASGERMGSGAWTKDGKNPFDYVQATDHEATAADVDNAPVYYARMIMAYVAMGSGDSVGTAGSKDANLLALLQSYQDITDGSSSKGAFSPVPLSTVSAVRTTSWAILAMTSLGLSATDNRLGMAAAWLAAQQSATDGGFASAARGGTSTALDTALVYQALSACSSIAGWDPAAARAFLKSAQLPDGGFPAEPGGKTDAEATSAAVQAIVTMGELPQDPAWTVGDSTPITALAALQRVDGSYRLASTDLGQPLAVTAWAVTAMRRTSFAEFPESLGEAEKAFEFRPVVRTVSPKNGAKFRSTRVVPIRATYTDHAPKGTGIDPSACRIYVDGDNRSRPADITEYGLRLVLKNVPDGDHAYKIEIRDEAGNVKVVEREFTVAVPTPTYHPTARPTYDPAPVYPTVYPTEPATPDPYYTDTMTPSPYSTSTPYPYDSPSPMASPVITGSPLPSPSTSASPAGTGADGGSAAGFVGGTLLAMLPIGAVISYLLLNRREELIGAAGAGTVLPGGGSPWDRFRQLLAKSKDLTRPSARE